MNRIAFSVLVFIGVSSAKHVMISTETSWQNAQTYCRKHHTDLSPITNELEDKVFRRFGWSTPGWIGLYRDRNSTSRWSWSKGSNPFWTHSTYNYECIYYPFVYWTPDSWYLTNIQSPFPFYCFNLIVVEVRMTWEGALEYCREVHTDLTSLHSETELLLALSEIHYDYITEQVWIGTRFLGDQWLWVDGDPFGFTAWPEEEDQDHQCPKQNRCGTLTKKGLWGKEDCEEKLNFICY
ncbi:secretory phospholipase A2 receptor-like [Xyrichtys novacula]|uniref:Secretory phospholipase A2 receptor-like n=1 Tax=Xyrichtys novacula TaxID=13765 RepID=A0AAV1EYB9_XYRNO|nr:secretory phospholipase A2 receptor-like [Xyrichtys novacula]